MPKGKDKGKAEEKKKPVLSLKEKREKKREKKSAKDQFELKAETDVSVFFYSITRSRKVSSCLYILEKTS